MSKPSSKGGFRGARLEAVTRKALADVWARGVTMKEANRMAVQMIHEKFPEMSESKISAVIRTVRRGLG
jgi:phage terminase large subunit GpA-like protein